jgi:hypothetical protein
MEALIATLDDRVRSGSKAAEDFGVDINQA